MVCATCQEDFEPEVTQCPYCGAPTGVVPAQGSATESDDLGPLIPVHEAWTEDELSRATEALASEGIPFLVQGQNAYRGIAALSLPTADEAIIAFHHVLVPEELAEKAAVLLAKAMAHRE